MLTHWCKIIAGLCRKKFLNINWLIPKRMPSKTGPGKTIASISYKFFRRFHQIAGPLVYGAKLADHEESDIEFRRFTDSNELTPGKELELVTRAVNSYRLAKSEQRDVPQIYLPSGAGRM